MSIDITIEEMEALPAESYELFDIRGEIERAHDEAYIKNSWRDDQCKTSCK